MRRADTLNSPLDGLPPLPGSSEEPLVVATGEEFAKRTREFLQDARPVLSQLPIDASTGLSHVLDDPRGLLRDLEEKRLGTGKESLTIRGVGHAASLGLTCNRHIRTTSFDGSIPTETVIESIVAAVELRSNGGRIATLSSRDMMWHTAESDHGLAPDIADLAAIIQVLSDAIKRLREPDQTQL